jgi:hypothetical protein
MQMLKSQNGMDFVHIVLFFRSVPLNHFFKRLSDEIGSHQRSVVEQHFADIAGKGIA